MDRFNLIDWFKTNLEERMLEGNFCEDSLLCGLDLEKMGVGYKDSLLGIALGSARFTSLGSIV